MTSDTFRLSYSQFGPFLIHDVSHDLHMSKTMGANHETGTTYPSGAPDSCCSALSL